MERGVNKNEGSKQKTRASHIGMRVQFNGHRKKKGTHQKKRVETLPMGEPKKKTKELGNTPQKRSVGREKKGGQRDHAKKGMGML